MEEELEEVEPLLDEEDAIVDDTFSNDRIHNGTVEFRDFVDDECRSLGCI